MIIMSSSAALSTEIDQMSIRNSHESSEGYENVYNWKNRGYSTILDVMMVIINQDVHKLKQYYKFFILF